MLILGRKYKFNQFELKILNKKFKQVIFVGASEFECEKSSSLLENLKQLVQNNEIKLLVINLNIKIDSEFIKYLIKLLFVDKKKRIKIMTIEQFLEKYLKKCYIPDDSTDLSYLSNNFPYRKFQYFLKRIVDYAGAFVMWLAYLYFKPKVKEAHKRESPGPLFYTQTRVGKYGKKFVCYKFRTMCVNNECKLYTKENDERIFPYGKFLRETRIDELPQYKNILKGEMHLVGPRAEWDIVVEEYEKKIPFYNLRHLSAPGLTGWAQINYPYGTTIEDERQKLMYDLYYIKNWSFLLELKIIAKTIPVIFGKKGK